MPTRARSLSASPRKNFASETTTSTTSSSTKAYERLQNLPSDPNDPEHLAELHIIAFGAFGRFYICWKNQNSDYRQDSYGLPDRLQSWLFPADGSTRHFPTLQVVLGHGDEYFASDQVGKVDNMNTDLREKSPRNDSPDETLEKPALRRSRTLSMVRPASQPNVKLQSPILESRRPSPVLAMRSSGARPKSIAFSSDALQQQLERMPIRPKYTCNHHAVPPPRRTTYADASVQTDPAGPEHESSSPSSPRTWSSVSGIGTPATEVSLSDDLNPISMGRMLDYFHAPKYQLGDALSSTYFHRPMYPELSLSQNWQRVLERRRTV